MFRIVQHRNGASEELLRLTRAPGGGPLLGFTEYSVVVAGKLLLCGQAKLAVQVEADGIDTDVVAKESVAVDVTVPSPAVSPAAPSALKLVVATSDSLNVSWTAPVSFGGGSWVGYMVSVSGSGKSFTVVSLYSL
jgi:hypothetical protein